jgi:hypothetical protein
MMCLSAYAFLSEVPGQENCRWRWCELNGNGEYGDGFGAFADMCLGGM